MNEITFGDQVVSTWLEYFSSVREDADSPGTTVVPREGLKGSGGLHVVHIRAHAYAEVDPLLAEELNATLANSAHSAPLAAASLGSIIQPDRILSTDQGLVFHLDLNHLHRTFPPSSIQLKALGPAEKLLLDNLAAQCTPVEVDDAYVAVDHAIAAGCLAEDDLVSAGSGYRRNGFMDIGVLTHPKFRGMGLAKVIVAALAEACAPINIIPQYRCDVSNHSSRRVAEGAGFTLSFRTESLVLRPNGRPPSNNSMEPTRPAQRLACVRY